LCLSRLLSQKVIPQNKINWFIETHRGTSYPDTGTWEGRWKLAASALDFYLFGNDLLSAKKGDTVFCTELAVMLLQTLGLFAVSEWVFAWEFEPDDTRPDGKAEEHLWDCKLESEIQLKG